MVITPQNVGIGVHPVKMQWFKYFYSTNLCNPNGRPEPVPEAVDPMEELNHGIDELRGRLKLLLDETGVLTRKVKEALLRQKQKERDFILAKRAIERIKMAI